MLCPQCETEYREGITRCADCDVALVDEIAPGFEDALVMLLSTANFEAVADLSDRLEKAGVPYVVEAGTALRLLDHPEEPMQKPDDWEARVWVATTFKERAERILSQL